MVYKQYKFVKIFLNLFEKAICKNVWYYFDNNKDILYTYCLGLIAVYQILYMKNEMNHNINNKSKQKYLKYHIT